eukprot:scaffold57009_cov50-Attheya_sp.AAC.1
MPVHRDCSTAKPYAYTRGNVREVSASSRSDAEDHGTPFHRPFGHENWRVWAVADRLETEGISSSSSSDGSKAGYDASDRLAKEAAQILRVWGEQWAGQPGWQTLLNKKSLQHEMEESIVTLGILMKQMDRFPPNADPITVVDVCCGKGIFSMLASYMFQNDARVSKIIMLDKQQTINWNHIVASNQLASEEYRPVIETWGGCNLFETDRLVECFEEVPTPVAMVGIHLCKGLSPAFMGLANALGPTKCPILCLAPCCLPRLVTRQSKLLQQQQQQQQQQSPNNGNNNEERHYSPEYLLVQKYESPCEKSQRREANARRDAARTRGRTCYMCSSSAHVVQQCALLPTDQHERLVIFERAVANAPCWKCGAVGHLRADCPINETRDKPKLTLTLPPTVKLDVSGIMSEPKPFPSYCQLLASSLEQRDVVQVLEMGLIHESVQHNNRANQNNWNRDRKSIYIVATATR